MARGALKPIGKEKSIRSKALDLQDELLRADEVDGERLLRLGCIVPVGPYGPYSVDELLRDNRELAKEMCWEYAELAMSNVGGNLALARMRAGMTQTEAAKLAGISRRKLQAIESGEREVSITELVALCELFGTHPERVMGIIGEKEEALLNVYEASTPRQKGEILRAAEMIHGLKDQVDKAQADFEDHVREVRKRLEA